MSQANEVELEMLALINAERASAGLNAVQLNTALNEAAEDHSAWMLESDRFSHTGEAGSSAGERMADAAFPFEGNYTWAENIGWQSERGAPGISDDVADIHESLMNSPGHRANILNPNITEVGIGIEQGDFTVPQGTFDGVMVTQNFAATDGDISALRDPGTLGDAENVAETPAPAPSEPEVATDPPVIEDAPEDPPMMEDAPEEAMPEPEETPEPETPDPPIAEAPEADPPALNPLLVGWFFDLSDRFEFTQEGDRLVFETSVDDLWAGFANRFDAYFGDDDNMDMPTEMAVDDTNVMMPDMTFDCA